LFRYSGPGDHAGMRASVPVHETSARRKERELYEVAEKQNQVVTTSQLLAVGFTYPAINRWVAMGRLFRLHRGVYLVGRPPASREARFHAAVLACGSPAALTGFAAAALWGFWRGSTSSLEVIAPGRLRKRHGIVVHRVVVMPEVSEHAAIPVATPEQTIVHLAGTMYSDRHFRRLVHEALVQETTSLSALLAEVEGASERTPAIERIERELADGANPTRSFLEDDLLELLRRGNFPPFETNVHVPGTPAWVEVDVWFPFERLVVEIDGPHHETSYRREFDAYKDGVVAGAGASVLRFDKDALKPARVKETCARILFELG
jgi:very-short-patch-repair endonuclease